MKRQLSENVIKILSVDLLIFLTRPTNYSSLSPSTIPNHLHAAIPLVLICFVHCVKNSCFIPFLVLYSYPVSVKSWSPRIVHQHIWKSNITLKLISIYSQKVYLSDEWLKIQIIFIFVCLIALHSRASNAIFRLQWGCPGIPDSTIRREKHILNILENQI